MKAFEIKWNPKAKTRFPKTYLKAYPQSDLQVLTPEDFEGFLGVL